ncbi:DUF4365 domain-containing protein [Nocardia vinacea]|uniref:DUF4365 domain-containing protein n=1 Tax=Nocardia vinacea TaxID=96468 RepID=UPI002E10A13C|nr:DUF4365 domain-containing protein [Nocardia vinacea]
MSEKTNRLAVNAAESAVLRIDWFFRSQEVSDQGIDALIEKFEWQTGADGKSCEVGTGRLIAVQIKGGSSHFGEPSPDGWWFRFDEKKRKLWFGHALPVIVVLVDLDDGVVYWQRISPSTVVKTGKNYKVNVPRAQRVPTADAEWVELASGLELRARSRFEYSLLHLPPSARTMLSQRPEERHADAALLAMHLCEGRANPKGTVSALLATKPSWLEREAPWGWMALGNYANEHNLHDLAANAFECAIDNADEVLRSRLLITAAILLLGSDNDRAKRLLSRAHAKVETHEGDQLLRAVARTIMSRPPGDSGPMTVDPLLVEDTEQVRASSPAQRILAISARRTGDFNKAVKHAAAALAADPSSTHAMALVAEFLLARWTEQGASTTDLKQAINHLRALIAQRKQWSGPIEAEQRRLVRVLHTVGRFEEVLDVALPPLLGAADDTELHMPCIRIAAHSALALGQRERLDQATTLLGDAPEDLLTKVDVGALTMSDENITNLRLQCFQTAIENDEFEDIARHGMALAFDGVDVRDRLQSYVDRSIIPHSLIELATALLAARIDLDSALPDLHELARTDAAAAMHLIGLLREAGRFRDVAEIAHELYELTHSESYLIEKATALIDAEAGTEAVHAAEEAVARNSSIQPVDLSRLLTFLGAQAFAQQDWSTAESHLSRALNLFAAPSGTQVWRVVVCLTNQGRIKQAARLIDDYNPPVTSLEEAHLWFHAHATLRWNAKIAMQAYALAERFDDPQLATALLSHIVFNTHAVDENTTATSTSDDADETRGTHGDADLGASAWDTTEVEEFDDTELERRRQLAQDTVPADLHRRAFELINTLAQRHGDGIGITILTGAPDELMDQMIHQLQRAAAAAPAVEELIRMTRASRFPIGFLAGATGRSYTTLVLQRALGVLVASSPIDEEHEIEMEAARAALGARISIDASAIVTLTGLTKPHALTGRFNALIVPPPTMHDLHRASADMRSLAGSFGRLSWNAQLETAALAELSDQEFDRLNHRAECIDTFTQRLVVRSVNEPSLLRELSHYTEHTPWIHALELAQQEDTAIWTDDLGMRRLARSLNLTAFGTPALIDAVRTDRLEKSTTAEADDAAVTWAATLNMELARDYVVDLPLTHEELLRLAEEDDWKARTAAAPLTRPAWWAANHAGGILTLRTIYARARTHSPHELVSWQYAAMHGLTRAIRPEAAPAVLALLALTGFDHATTDEERAQGLSQARQIAAELGIPDPASGLPSAAAVVQQSGECDDPDELVQRVLAIADATDQHNHESGRGPNRTADVQLW